MEIKRNILNLADRNVVNALNDYAETKQLLLQQPLDINAVSLLNDSIAAFILLKNDKVALHELLNELEPALNVFRKPYLDLSKEEVRAWIKKNICSPTRDSTYFIHPQIPITESLIYSMLWHENTNNSPINDHIDEIVDLLRIAIQKEGYSSNALIHVTKQNEYYNPYDKCSTLAESLYFHKPSLCLGAINRLLIDLYEREPFRKHPYLINGDKNDPCDSFDVIPFCLFNGNYPLVQALSERGAYLSSEQIRAQMACVSLAMLQMKITNEGFDEKINFYLDSFNELIKAKIVDVHHLVVAFNKQKDPDKILNPDKQNGLQFYLVNVPDIYDAISFELLNSKINSVVNNIKPVELPNLNKPKRAL